MNHHEQAGYTLIELLVSAAVLLLLTALTCLVLVEAKTAMDVSGERADVQQRARAAVENMLSAIRAAGTGSDRGIRAGPLIGWVPPLWAGRGDRTQPSTAITTLRVLPDIAPATLAIDAPTGTATLDFDRGGCALPCGFTDGMKVIVLDGRGDFDLFVLIETDGASATVRRVRGGTNASYARGSTVLAAELRTFYWNAATRELRSDDGDRGDFPAISNVAGLSFEYAGDPFPPLHPRPPAGEENCLYDSAGTPRRGMPVLPPAGGSLAPLDPRLFEDGPWCGVGTEPFDADLLRIRSLRLVLRTQAAASDYRGTDPRLFQNPGSGTNPARLVHDVVLQTSVTPRNLGGWR
jgi:prepilin-type N-terminal cleavage/methylation domain-containing protein